MIIPIIMIVLANTIYNLCTHSTPKNVNPFTSILITYITSGMISFVLMLFTLKGQRIVDSIREVNFSSIGLGFGIVLLECGFILAFRAGWEIGKCALIANTILAIILLFVGAFVYGEELTLNKIIGISVCIFGLYLINK